MSIIPSAAPNDTSPAPLSPEREAEIRAFEEDEHRNVLTMARDLDDILAELDRVRAELAAKPAEVERKVRSEIAADFIRQGKASNSLTWGQAHEIALNGLCSCSGGNKPCSMGGAA